MQNAQASTKGGEENEKDSVDMDSCGRSGDRRLHLRRNSSPLLRHVPDTLSDLGIDNFGVGADSLDLKADWHLCKYSGPKE